MKIDSKKMIVSKEKRNHHIKKLVNDGMSIEEVSSMFRIDTNIVNDIVGNK